MIELLGGSDVSGPPARPLGRAAAQDGQGAAPPGAARRPGGGIRPGSRRGRWTTSACPSARSRIWSSIPQKLPWRAPEGAAPSPKALVSGRPLNAPRWMPRTSFAGSGSCPIPRAASTGETFRSGLTLDAPRWPAARPPPPPSTISFPPAAWSAWHRVRVRRGLASLRRRRAPSPPARPRVAVRLDRADAAGGRAGGRVAGGRAGGARRCSAAAPSRRGSTSRTSSWDAPTSWWPPFRTRSR